MKKKIETAIAALVFSTMASIHLAIVPAIVVFHILGKTNAGFWAYVASVPMMIVPLFVILVRLAKYMDDALGDDGHWVTVEKKGEAAGKVKRKVKAWKGGKPDHELEQYLNR